MEAALKLALWLRGALPENAGAMTHLKLQKLLFYTYGAASALGQEAQVGEICFEAWHHGPVNVAVWEEYRKYEASVIPKPINTTVTYPTAAESILRNALTVYGPLDAWSLRQQSHLEKPWLDASVSKGLIDKEALRKHFHAKFADGRVDAPEYLARTWNFKLDSLPFPSFASLEELARSVDRSRA